MSESIIELSAKAVEHLITVVAKHEGAVGVKFSMRPDGCAGYGYVTSFPKVIDAVDTVIEVDNLIVIIEQASIELIQGTKIELQSQTLGQKQLVFDNPQVKSACGCGLSVQLKREG